MSVKSLVLYFATNVFSKGGIERYTRAQIQALRELVGNRKVTTLVLHGPGSDQIEEPFSVEFIGKGPSVMGRLHFCVRATIECVFKRPNLVWTNHIGLLPLANAVMRLINNSRVIVNVYGLEVWSGLPNYKRLALVRAKHVVSDCHFTANYVMNRFGVPRDRISVIWDPVDVHKFSPRKVNPQTLARYGAQYRSNACYVMTLGRISKASRHKGYDRMLDVMKQINRNNLIYLIAGDGDDRRRLEQRVTDEGLAKRVFFLGSVHERDLVDIYNVADIFALISDRGKDRGEGVPLTPLEAAACGIPIIVGNEDGSPEAVKDGENGYVVSPRNLKGIRSAILRLADNPTLRIAMGRSGRLTMEREFSYNAFKKRTREMLNSLC